MSGNVAVFCRTLRTRVQLYEAAAQRRALARDPDVIRFSHWPDSQDDAFEVSVAAMQGRHPFDRGGWMNFAIVLRAGGYAGDHAVVVDGAAAKLGIALVPALRGRGLAQEVIAGSVAALRRHGVSRFQAEVDPENAASLALFERAGFQRARLQRDELGPFWLFERS